MRSAIELDGESLQLGFEAIRLTFARGLMYGKGNDCNIIFDDGVMHLTQKQRGS
jgi:hypothetical protein